MQSFTPRNPKFRERVQDSFQRQQFMQFIGAELIDIAPGYCEIQIAHHQNLTQQHGFFHGGVVGTVADNCAGYSAFSLMDADASVLTVEYKLNLIAPADGERIVGKGRVVKSGRTLIVCQTDVFVYKNQQEIQCATALATIMTLRGKSDYKK